MKDIFVFSCDLNGYHTKGSALLAKRLYRAKTGEIGFTGEAYGISTRDNGAHLFLNEIECEVDEFIEFAKEHQCFKFILTKIGCTDPGGYSESEIKELFRGKITDNIELPNGWEDLRNEK